jgi:hypothetical protein
VGESKRPPIPSGSQGNYQLSRPLLDTLLEGCLHGGASSTWIRQIADVSACPPSDEVDRPRLYDFPPFQTFNAVLAASTAPTGRCFASSISSKIAKTPWGMAAVSRCPVFEDYQRTYRPIPISMHSSRFTFNPVCARTDILLHITRVHDG